MLRRLGQVLLAGCVLALGVSALVVSAIGHPETGLAVDASGSFVEHVDPGGPTWQDGIRAGDPILELHDTLDPGGWSISAIDGDQTRTSSADGHLDRLRHFIPWSIIAFFSTLVAALLAYRAEPIAAVAVPIAIGLAAEPLLVAGNVVLGVVAGLALFVGGALAVLMFSSWRRWSALLAAAGVALGLCWVAASTTLPQSYLVIDHSRTPIILSLSVLGLITATDRRRLADFMTGKGGPAFVDIAYLSIVGTVVVAAGHFGELPIEFVVAIGIVAVAVYPFWRRSVLGAVERFLTSGARRDAAIRAVEDERGRLAREIHDAPLQELSGVIRRLEGLPGAEPEASALRAVAEGLRDVATSLHPPVLQDLGLAAAIADLGDHLTESHPDWSIVIDVDDVTLATRPPADVELAAYRIIQEATANSFAHSGGRRLEIGGVVTTDVIDLRATDDGHGFNKDDVRDARRAGHFGLDAMRERAAAVGARLLVSPEMSGASVHFHWERQ